MVVVIKILQVILALSVLILIHEAGHFMWAKIFGIRVDKFFLFFDAWGVKLFSTRQAWFVRLFPWIRVTSGRNPRAGSSVPILPGSASS